MARNRQKAKERQARRKAQQGRAAGDGAKAAPDGARSRPPAPPQPEPDRVPEEVEEPALAPEPADEADSPVDVESKPAAAAAADTTEDTGDEPDRGMDLDVDPVLGAHLRAGAPPEDTGRADEVLHYEQDLDAQEDEPERFDSAEDFPEEDLAPGPKGHRGRAEEHKDRPRLVQFLFAVWAELQRVQWPDRQALTTLTGVVLGFVLIAGGYLGLLDAIFSRVIQAIL